MIEITFPEASLLKNITNALKDLVKNIALEVDDQGLHVQAMDSANIALVALDLTETDNFEVFRVDKNASLGIDLEVLDKLLKLFDNRDRITLQLPNEKSELEIIVDHRAGTRTRSKYGINLLDLDVEALGVPDMEYEWCASMQTAEYSLVMNNLSIFHDIIDIGFSNGSAVFKNEGDLCKEAKIEYNVQTVKDEDDEEEREKVIHYVRSKSNSLHHTCPVFQKV